MFSHMVTSNPVKLEAASHTVILTPYNECSLWGPTIAGSYYGELHLN